MLSVAPLFLFPYCAPRTIAVVLLFLSLIAAFWIFLEPSRRSDELLHGARVRVFDSVRKDPLFWVFAVLAAYGAVRWLNDGVATVFYPAETVWRVRPPKVDGLPGSANGAGILPFATVVAVATVVTGCRHALGKAARICFAATASLLAGVAALSVLWACRCGQPAALASLGISWDSASFAGAAFGLHFIGGIAAIAALPELKWTKSLLLFSFAAGACGCGLFFFAPALVSFSFSSAALLVALASFVYVWMTQRPPDVLKCFAAVVLSVAIGVGIALAAAPQPAIDARLADFADGFFPEGFSALRTRLSEIAAAIWRDRVWVGAGAGSMPLEIKYCAMPADWAAWGGVAPKAVPNGWWQILAERGIIGIVALAVPLATMLATLVVRIVRSRGVRAFLPLAFCGVAAAALPAAETFVDSSLLRPETLTAAGAYLALAASSFPAAKRKNDEDEN